MLLFDIAGAAIAVVSLAFIKIPETNNYKKAKAGIRNVIQDMKTDLTLSEVTEVCLYYLEFL